MQETKEEGGGDTSGSRYQDQEHASSELSEVPAGTKGPQQAQEPTSKMKSRFYCFYFGCFSNLMIINANNVQDIEDMGMAIGRTEP